MKTFDQTQKKAPECGVLNTPGPQQFGSFDA